jgi:hypothetical protein
VPARAQQHAAMIIGGKQLGFVHDRYVGHHDQPSCGARSRRRSATRRRAPVRRARRRLLDETQLIGDEGRRVGRVVDAGIVTVVVSKDHGSARRMPPGGVFSGRWRADPIPRGQQDRHGRYGGDLPGLQQGSRGSRSRSCSSASCPRWPPIRSSCACSSTRRTSPRR